MAGLIPPQITKSIITGLKEKINIPIWIHTHETAGLGAATYLAAINAGVDAIDVSIAPFANGTGQPDALRMMAMLEGHPRRPDIDLDKLEELRQILTPEYEALSDYTSHKNEIVDSDTLRYQVPGGMLSNFRTQLKEQKMEDKFEEVFAEIPVVREALGWIPLVTPTSQIVGVQAMLNVKFGRWKNFSPQAMDIALGYYGSTPAPVDPEVQALAAKQAGKEPITCRPADLKEPGMDKLREELEAKGFPTDDEHCVIHAMFPMQLEDYFKKKNAPEEKTPEPAPAPAPAAAAPVSPAGHPDAKVRNMALTINGKAHHVLVEEL